MLDIIACSDLKRIPINVIPRLSRLEELYIGENSFKAWEVEGTSVEGSNASLFELNKLYCLTILTLYINVQPCLPKDFVLLTNLLRYDISVNDDDDDDDDDEGTSYPKSRILKISDIEATSLFAFKVLCKNVEYLKLIGIMGCFQNIVPNIVEAGVNELKRLDLQSFDELECIIDTTQQQDVASAALSDLVDLSRELEVEGLCYSTKNPFLLSSLESLNLVYLPKLRYIWKGPTQQVSLQNLTVVQLKWCNKLRYLFTLSLARSLLQLKELTVEDSRSLEHIVEIKEAVGGGNDVMFPKNLDRCNKHYKYQSIQNLITSLVVVHESSVID